MKYFALLAMFLGLNTALAARLEIENTHWVKAERYHQFKAYLYKDDGTRVDVTNDTLWRSMGNRERQRGEFLFVLPNFGSSDRFSATVEATYTGELGMLTDRKTIYVDATPDRIQIWGMSSTRSGGSITFRADGYYGAKRVDLTNKGRWSAIYGRVGSYGWYRAPMIRNGRTVYDTVTFRFGLRTARQSVLVR